MDWLRAMAMDVVEAEAGTPKLTDSGLTDVVLDGEDLTVRTPFPVS